ncbi:MAG TPA: acyl-CoA dehydrogenase family protein [Iamia sp.]|nr:acyl-CoA dehydrogenase family protein [Iamia sp.]
MDHTLPPELAALAEEARTLAGEWRGRRPFPEDSWLLGHDPDLAVELAARGWIGMTWPVAVGGGGRTALERFVVVEQLIAGGAPIAAVWFADRQIGPTLLQFGTDEQRARWLPGILAGTSMWCIGMSEPDAGSDVASLRTRAVRDGDTWVVDGQKVWTSGAVEADWMYLVARTDPAARPHEGLSELVVDMRSPGVEVRRIRDMTGGGHFCEVHLHEVRVPAGNLVGRENGSFRQVMRQMEHERGGIDRLVSNRLVWDDLLRSGWVDRTDPLVRQEVAALESAHRIGRLLVLREVLGQAPPSFSAATKTFCTELEQRVADFATRVAGPRATLLDPTGGLAARIARSACYAPAYTIMGGTTQVLRNVIGERVLGLPR